MNATEKKDKFIIDPYLPFKYKKEYNLSDILRNTKKLVKNSNKYNNFLGKYQNQTQTISFKLPEVSSYPVYKNEELISLTKRGFDHSKDIWFEKEQDCGMTIFSPNTTTKFNTGVHNSKSSSLTNFEFLQKSKQNKPGHKHTQSAISYFNSNTTRKTGSIESYLQKSGNNFKALTFMDMSSDFFQFGNQGRDKDTIEEFERRENLFYDESEIFNKSSYIFENMINSKIEYFKMNKNENFTDVFTKRFHQDMPNEMLLTVNAIIVEFKNITEFYKKPVKFQIPFSLLPIFYFKNCDEIKMILLSIIQFYESSFCHMNIIEDNLYNVLKNSSQFSTEESWSFRPGSIHNIYKFNWLTPKCIFEVSVK
jgi:hypothetical protein